MSRVDELLAYLGRKRCAMNRARMLEACTLTAVKLEPREGGTTAFSCKVESQPPAEKTAAKMWPHAGHEISVEILEVQADIEDGAE